jgi:hypothetical protein
MLCDLSDGDASIGVVKPAELVDEGAANDTTGVSNTGIPLMSIGTRRVTNRGTNRISVIGTVRITFCGT